MTQEPYQADQGPRAARPSKKVNTAHLEEYFPQCQRTAATSSRQTQSVT